jgi:hypothetical protein
MSDEILQKLRQIGPQMPAPAPASKTTDPLPADPDITEAPDRAGMVARFSLFGVVLEWKTGDSETIVYSAITSTISYNPSVGISFLFHARRETSPNSWEDGEWQVTIKGYKLAYMRTHLSSGRRESIRETGQTVTSIRITRAAFKPTLVHDERAERG